MSGSLDFAGTKGNEEVDEAPWLGYMDTQLGVYVSCWLVSDGRTATISKSIFFRIQRCFLFSQEAEEFEKRSKELFEREENSWKFCSPYQLATARAPWSGDEKGLHLDTRTPLQGSVRTSRRCLPEEPDKTVPPTDKSIPRSLPYPCLQQLSRCIYIYMRATKRKKEKKEVGKGKRKRRANGQIGTYRVGW